MKLLALLIKVELKKARHKGVLTIILLIFALCFGLLQYGIGEHQDSLALMKKFQELERQKISLYVTYAQYGTYGINLLFIPSINSIFSVNSVVLPELQATVDTGERLKIYNPILGKNLFTIKKYGFTDFSGILLFFATLLSMIYGFEGFLNVGYIKFQCALSSPKRMLFSLIAARAIILLMFLVILMGLSMLQIAINGLPVPIGFMMMGFLPLIYLLLVFFLSLGFVASTLKSKYVGFTVAVACWGLLVFILPQTIDFYVANQSKWIKSIQAHELEKLTIMMSVEKKAIEKGGKPNFSKPAPEIAKSIAKDFYNNQFKKFGEMEARIRAQIGKNIRWYHFLTMFAPTTYYSSVTNELSGSGYLNFLKFYSYSQEQKKAFFEYYMKKVFFTKHEGRLKVENFIKGNENIFYATSQLPSTFIWGLLLIFLYIGVLFKTGQSRMIRKMSAPDDVLKRRTQRDAVTISISTGEMRAYRAYDQQVAIDLFNLYSGCPFFPQTRITLLYNDQELSTGTPIGSFLYVPKTDILPVQMEAGDLLRQITLLLQYTPAEMAALPFLYLTPQDMKKKLQDLTALQLGELLLTTLVYRKRDFYLIDDLCDDMPGEVYALLNKRLLNLQKHGVTSLIMYTGLILSASDHRKNSVQLFENEEWSNMITAWEKVNNFKPGSSERK